MRTVALNAARLSSAVAVAALFTVGLVAAPGMGVAPAEPASAADLPCEQLVHGDPCTFGYAEYAGVQTIAIPAGVDTVTVMLAGGSGDGNGDDQGGAGLGGIAIGTLDVSTNKRLDFHLGDAAHGRSGGEGWADGGEGAEWRFGNDGYGGGGASAVAYPGGLGAPLIVAGGGGGGGGSSYAKPGGAGGSGVNPPASGENGAGNAYGGGGKGGGESGHAGGAGGGNTQSNALGGGGGGGGAGYNGGEGGGYGEWWTSFGYSSGGGGGGGSSAAAADVDMLGYGAAPQGPGWITVFPGTATRYECTGIEQQLTIPADVDSYAVIATAGAGGHGNSVARGGHGALVTGVLDVTGLDELKYWIGCSGAEHGALAGWGWAHGAAGGDAPSALARDGGHGGGATALATPSGTLMLVAGGGGGSGGDTNGSACSSAPGSYCGGRGGSGGGTPASALSINGADGSNGDGGRGGKGDSNWKDKVPNPNGSEGVSSGLAEAGGGGGGGGGYPMGGEGGHHEDFSGGGGGGAGGSFVNTHYISAGSISTSADQAGSGDMANGYLLLLPIVTPDVDLTITKVATGPASEYAVSFFDMTLACMRGGKPVVDETFQLTPNGKRTFSVPENVSCTVTETDAGGASIPAPPQTFTVGPGSMTVTMTNEFQGAPLTIAVHSSVIGEDRTATDTVGLSIGELEIGVECRLDGRDLSPLPSPAQGPVVPLDGDDSFRAAGVSATMSNIAVGARCRVTQPAAVNATRTTYTVNGTALDAGEWFTLTAAGATVDIANEFDLMPLTVFTVTNGEIIVPPGTAFAGRVTCTFNGSPVTFSAPRTFSGLGDGAHTDVHGLPVGGRCTVTETDTGGAAAVTYSPAQAVPMALPQTTVQIANTFSEATLGLHVTSTGAGVSWAAGDVSLHLVCTDPTTSSTVLDTTVTMPVAGGWKDWVVDIGSVCTVAETDTAGATSVSYATTLAPTPSSTPVQLTVSTMPDSLTVSNAFDTGSLELVVAPSGAGVLHAASTVVTVDRCTLDGAAIDITPGVASMSFDFAALGGHATIPELVAGAECFVSLSDTGGATRAEILVENGAPSTPQSDWATTATVSSDGTTVTFDTGFDVAALEVAVDVTGDGSWAANHEYRVDVACELSDIPMPALGRDGTTTVRFAADGTPIDDLAREVLKTLPVGASCTVTQTEDGGATRVEPPDEPITIAAPGVSVTITNTFDAAALTVTKAVAGNAAIAHQDEPFSFQAACWFNDVLLGNPPTRPDRAMTFSLAGGDEAVFDDMPVGATCEAIEHATRHATSVAPGTVQTASIASGGAVIGFTNVFEVAALKISEQVTGPGAPTYGLGQTFFAKVTCRYADGDPAVLSDEGRVWLDAAGGFTGTLPVPVGTTCRAVQPVQLATTQTTTPPVAIVLGGRHDITITSSYEVGAIAVGKRAHGVVEPGTQFGFATQCTFPGDDGRTVVVPLDSDAAEEFTLASGAQRTVQALAYATCTTTETSSAGALRVVVTATGLEASVEGARASLVVSPTAAGTVEVSNFMPGSLPVTGGEFAEVLAAVGAVLAMLGAGLLLLRRIRARRPTL